MTLIGSEEKIGNSLADVRENIIISTKTMAKTTMHKKTTRTS